ncbi:hypothetical protein E2562_025194 [Oryza meyeriana var. granulata]|uniref:Uncharacterized protein n=1 Tax=Oryza meyeriana var. granulata TaxID=110450 RepID=A0A6G1E2H5_9ORYZ|nr:hypothetical protein E2562_025194 [Oryza meyeriana var. granulata]
MSQPLRNAFDTTYIVPLWLYLLALFILTIFAFVVTNRGAGWVVTGRGYKEIWAKIRGCLQDGKVCEKLGARHETLNTNLSPVQDAVPLQQQKWIHLVLIQQSTRCM